MENNFTENGSQTGGCSEMQFLRLNLCHCVKKRCKLQVLREKRLGISFWMQSEVFGKRL